MSKDEETPEHERMKLCYIDFTSHKVSGVNVENKSSSVRGKTLEECMEYTKLLHDME